MSDHNILSDAELQALSDAMHVCEAPLSVLVVDDDPHSREVLAEILQLHDIQCATAGSAVQALTCLRADKSIGVMVTDLRMMPDTGLDLIREVRESDRAALPIIIMSGDAGVKDAIAAMHLSVVDFLLKPIDANLLVRLVKQELGIA